MNKYVNTIKCKLLKEYIKIFMKILKINKFQNVHIFNGIINKYRLQMIKLKHSFNTGKFLKEVLKKILRFSNK